MTTRGLVVSHAEGAHFERGLRSFFEHRDLGIARIRHCEIGHSDDLELLEIMTPADFVILEGDSVEGASVAP